MAAVLMRLGSPATVLAPDAPGCQPPNLRGVGRVRDRPIWVRASASFTCGPACGRGGLEPRSGAPSRSRRRRSCNDDRRDRKSGARVPDHRAAGRSPRRSRRELRRVQQRRGAVELCLFDEAGRRDPVESPIGRRVRLAGLSARRAATPTLWLSRPRSLGPFVRRAVQPDKTAARPLRPRDCRRCPVAPGGVRPCRRRPGST